MSASKELIHLTIPIFITLVLSASVGVVDAYFVGRLGTRELAAMAIALPVLMLLMGMSVALGTGVRTAIARAVGSGDGIALQRLATHALPLATGAFLALAGVGTFIQQGLYRVLGADDGLGGLVAQYMTPIWIGLPALGLLFVQGAIFQGAGQVLTTAALTLFVAVTNALLCPLLVLGFGPVPAYGLKGAGVAAVVAWSLAVLTGLLVLYRRRLLLLRALTDGSRGDAWRSILSVALPNVLGNSLQPVSAAFLTGIVATHGVAAVAAWGVGDRVQQLVSMGFLALAGALNVLVGVAWGAKDHARVAVLVRHGRRLAHIWGMLACVGIALSAEPLARALTSDEAVARALTLLLQIVPFGAPFLGALVASAASFNATGRGWIAAGLGLCSGVLFAVPAARVASQWGLRAVFLAVVLAAFCAWLVARYALRRHGMLVRMTGTLAQAEVVSSADGVAAEGLQ